MRRKIEFADRLQKVDLRIKAVSERLETLKLIRQALIEGEKLKADKILASIAGVE